MREDNFEIPYDVRMQNIAFFGSKGSGKGNHILPLIANNQFDQHQEGALIIVEDHLMSWMLYALAKKYHRKVTFLSPSCNNQMKDLIDIGVSTVGDIEQLIDFEEVMREKQIVIVDAEPYRYKKRSVDLVASLLMQLQSSMHTNSHETPFFTYVQDGDLYLPYLKDLLTYGNQFGMGSVLFFKGRALLQAESPVLSYFVEANIRTTVLTNALLHEDFKYFKDRFYGDAEDDVVILQRKPNQLLVETIDEKGSRKVVFADVRFLQSQIIREIEEEAIRLRQKPAVDMDFSYSVAKEVVASEPKKKSKKRANNTPRAPIHPAQPTNQPNKIFISEEDLFL